MSEQVVTKGGVELQLTGGDPGSAPLLLLHGLTFDARSFAGLTAHLPRTIEWWASDFRGHGNSGWTEPPYLYNDLIGDTVTVIRDGIRKPVYLFGHSLGGAVALAVAAHAPEWVQGLIVSDNFLTRKSYAVAAQQPLVRTLFTGLSKLASQKLDGRAIARALAELELPGPDGRTIPLGQFPGNSPEFLSLWANALGRCDPDVALMTLDERNQSAFEGEAYLEQLRCPLLLLQADTGLGGMLPDEDVELARRITPHLTLKQFPGTGHFMHLHDPDSTAAAVADFIRKVGQGG